MPGYIHAKTWWWVQWPLRAKRSSWGLPMWASQSSKPFYPGRKLTLAHGEDWSPDGLALPWEAVLLLSGVSLYSQCSSANPHCLKTSQPAVIGKGMNLNCYTHAFCERFGCCCSWSAFAVFGSGVRHLGQRSSRLGNALKIPDYTSSCWPWFPQAGTPCFSFRGTLEEPAPSWRLSLHLVPRV